MEPTTRDEKIYLILKTIENNEGIGPTQLHIKTKIPKKTLYKYLKELDTDQVINKKKVDDEISNSRVSYFVNFSEYTKDAINNNLATISKYNKWYTDKKFRKFNTFPHHLQDLAAEYYQNMMSFLFDNVSAYKFGVKRMEELLDTEKKRLDKEFKGKSKLRLWEACNEVHFNLVENASDSIYDAASRNSLRTRDEILIDCANPRSLGMGTQHKQEKKIMGVNMTIGNFIEDSRVHHIKDKKMKKRFIELADEYDRLSNILSGIKRQLAGITGAYPFEPTNVDDEPFEFFGIESR